MFTLELFYVLYNTLIRKAEYGKARVAEGSGDRHMEGMFLVTTSNTFVALERDFSVNTDS